MRCVLSLGLSESLISRITPNFLEVVFVIFTYMSCYFLQLKVAFNTEQFLWALKYALVIIYIAIYISPNIPDHLLHLMY
jgi:hypothetical protein